MLDNTGGISTDTGNGSARSGVAPRGAMRSGLRIAIVFLAAFMVYLPTVRNGFVWDDIPIVRDNPDIQSMANAPMLLASEDTYKGEHTGYYRPATHISFMLDYAVWGPRPGGFHFTNTVLHAAACVLLYLFLLRLGIGADAAVLGALFFGLSPANNEAVNFISGGRNTLLCGSFMLAALIAHMDQRRALAVALYTVAAFSKEFALLMPAMLVAHALILEREGTSPRKVARDVAPYIIVVLAYLAARHFVLDGMGFDPEWGGLGQRIANMPRTFMLYAKLMVYPFSLSTPRYLQHDVGLGAGVAAAVMLLVIAAVLRRFREQRAVPYGFTWFCIFFIPVSGLLPLGDVLAAERYIYVSSMGAAIVVAHACSLAAARRAAAVMGVLLIAFAVRDVTRSPIWRDNVSIFRHMMTDAPKSSMGFYNMGVEEFRKHNYARARDLLTKATERLPRIGEAYFMLSTINRSRGEYAEALANLDKALAIKPRDPRMLMVRAFVLDMVGRKAEADVIRAEVERDRPGIMQALMTRAMSLYDEGMDLMGRGLTDDAMDRFTRALEYNPSFPDPHFQTGNILASRGQYSKAADAFRRASELSPSSVEAFYNLALAMHLSGRTDDAAAAMRRYFELGGEPTWESGRILGRGQAQQ